MRVKFTLIVLILLLIVISGCSGRKIEPLKQCTPCVCECEKMGYVSVDMVNPLVNYTNELIDISNECLDSNMTYIPKLKRGN